MVLVKSPLQGVCGGLVSCQFVTALVHLVPRLEIAEQVLLMITFYLRGRSCAATLYGSSVI